MTSVSPIYVDLASESEDPTVTQIESLCLSCQSQGITKLLMTKIPHFKEIILMSFECNNCGYRNNNVQSSSWQEKGVTFELKISDVEDLKRQIVTSGYCTVSIPAVELEIEPNGQKGEVTTVEGVVRKVITNLEESKPHFNSEDLEGVNNFINKLESALELTDFVLVVDDPSGNSYVEYLDESADDKLSKKFYARSSEQNEALGIVEEVTDALDIIAEENDDEEDKTIDLPEDFREEVLSFNTICDQCSRPSSTKMKVTSIPHFKEVIIMATECDHCGYRSNEVKSGGGMEEKGRKATLSIQNSIDMSRDVLKSETCSIHIPEFDLNVGAGIVVGKFTTVEGLLTDIKEDLAKNPFLMGDSAGGDRKAKVQELVCKIQKVLDGSLKVHLVLDDPAGNSYLQDIYAPEPDTALTIEDYERTFDQNEDLGFNDMKTENYTDEQL